MLRPYDVCTECGLQRKNLGIWNGRFVCDKCFTELENLAILQMPNAVEVEAKFNEPEHYHKHDIDTIEFLKRGFPKEVFMGFALGSIIKYAQRANYKNGLEDFDKLVDYAIRARNWYEETHS
jgi:hypothetical protein